jgi:hypothetical protein
MHLQHVRFGEAHRCDSAVTWSFGQHARYEQQADLVDARGEDLQRGRILNPFAGSGTPLVAT